MTKRIKKIKLTPRAEKPKVIPVSVQPLGKPAPKVKLKPKLPANLFPV